MLARASSCGVLSRKNASRRVKCTVRSEAELASAREIWGHSSSSTLLEYWCSLTSELEKWNVAYMAG